MIWTVGEKVWRIQNLFLLNYKQAFTGNNLFTICVHYVPAFTFNSQFLMANVEQYGISLRKSSKQWMLWVRNGDRWLLWSITFLRVTVFLSKILKVTEFKYSHSFGKDISPCDIEIIFSASVCWITLKYNSFDQHAEFFKNQQHSHWN